MGASITNDWDRQLEAAIGELGNVAGSLAKTLNSLFRNARLRPIVSREQYGSGQLAIQLSGYALITTNDECVQLLWPGALVGEFQVRSQLGDVASFAYPVTAWMRESSQHVFEIEPLGACTWRTMRFDAVKQWAADAGHEQKSLLLDWIDAHRSEKTYFSIEMDRIRANRSWGAGSKPLRASNMIQFLLARFGRILRSDRQVADFDDRRLELEFALTKPQLASLLGVRAESDFTYPNIIRQSRGLELHNDRWAQRVRDVKSGPYGDLFNHRQMNMRSFNTGRTN